MRQAAPPAFLNGLDRANAVTRSLIVQNWVLAQLTRACLSRSLEALAISHELLRQPLYEARTGQIRPRAGGAPDPPP